MHHGAADVLTRGIDKIQLVHEVFGFLCVDTDLPTVEIGNKCAISGVCKFSGDAFDLIV